MTQTAYAEPEPTVLPPAVTEGSGQSTQPTLIPPAEAGAEPAPVPATGGKASTAPPRVPPGATAAKPPDTLYVTPPPEPGLIPDEEVPGLKGKLDEYDKRAREEGWDRQRYLNAYEYTRKRMNQEYADQAHKRQAEAAIAHAQDERISNEYSKRMTSNSPNYPTTDEIRVDDRLTFPAKERLINDIVRSSRGEPMTAPSYELRTDMSRRLHAPEDDPERITTERQINEQYWAKKLTTADRDGLVKEFREMKDLTKSSLNSSANKLIQDTVNKIRPYKSWGPAFENEMDPEGPQREQRFSEDLKTEMNKYFNDDKKNARDLFDSKKPDYFARPENVKNYQMTGAMSPEDRKAKAAANAKPPAGANYDTLAGIQAAVAAGTITREQGIVIARGKGLLQPQQPPPGSGAPLR